MSSDVISIEVLMYLSQAETLLQTLRRSYVPTLPPILQDLSRVSWVESPSEITPSSVVAELFPHSSSFPFLKGIIQDNASSSNRPQMRVGVVFSGGPASGGHNVVAGIYDGLKQLDPKGVLFGFLNGPEGILNGAYKQIDLHAIDLYRNLGGFDLLGSGRIKIETQELLDAALDRVTNMQLTGLIVIGGDDSNTNAAVMAEYFLKKGCLTRVIGVPKTIDGDLRNPYVELSFGFDTACKTYAELIGNIERDALSARKYYHFIKLMGRSASHISLECALITQPNLALIGEEVAELKRSLSDLVAEITDLICERAELAKYFGVILIPEGIVECIPEVAVLIQELNALLLETPSLDIDQVTKKLTSISSNTFNLLPSDVQKQLLLHRDPHGNVQVSSIETEKLFLELVKQELQRREKQTGKKIPFAAVQHFLGYEGRAAFPSNFDCNYCSALGRVAALLVASERTGYMACVRNLTKPPQEWTLAAIPITPFMQMELRKGKQKPVIAKTLVGLRDKAFLHFQKLRASHRLEDHYRNSGPIQFYGDLALTDTVPKSLVLNQDSGL